MLVPFSRSKAKKQKLFKQPHSSKRAPPPRIIVGTQAHQYTLTDSQPDIVTSEVHMGHAAREKRKTRQQQQSSNLMKTKTEIKKKSSIWFRKNK